MPDQIKVKLEAAIPICFVKTQEIASLQNRTYVLKLLFHFAPFYSYRVNT